MRVRARFRAHKSGVGKVGATGGSAVPSIRLIYDPPDIAGLAYSIAGFRKRLRVRRGCKQAERKWGRYGFASGAASTALQAAGRAAMVMGGLGLGGIGGGFGCRIESLNQKARSPALHPSPSVGSG